MCESEAATAAEAVRSAKRSAERPGVGRTRAQQGAGGSVNPTDKQQGGVACLVLQENAIPLIHAPVHAGSTTRYLAPSPGHAASGTHPRHAPSGTAARSTWAPTAGAWRAACPPGGGLRRSVMALSASCIHPRHVLSQNQACQLAHDTHDYLNTSGCPFPAAPNCHLRSRHRGRQAHLSAHGGCSPH